jgi:hypothetical protein
MGRPVIVPPIGMAMASANSWSVVARADPDEAEAGVEALPFAGISIKSRSPPALRALSAAEVGPEGEVGGGGMTAAAGMPPL